MNTLICEIAPVRFHVGDVIRKLRLERGLTVGQLADAAKVNKMTVSAIERGESNYRRDTIEQIAKALRTDPEEIFALVPGSQRDRKTQTGELLTQEDLDLLDRFRLASDKARISMRTFLQELVSDEQLATYRERRNRTANTES